jgi:hypothetical protein
MSVLLILHRLIRRSRRYGEWCKRLQTAIDLILLLHEQTTDDRAVEAVASASTQLTDALVRHARRHATAAARRADDEVITRRVRHLTSRLNVETIRSDRQVKAAAHWTAGQRALVIIGSMDRRRVLWRLCVTFSDEALARQIAVEAWYAAQTTFVHPLRPDHESTLLIREARRAAACLTPHGGHLRARVEPQQPQRNHTERSVTHQHTHRTTRTTRQVRPMHHRRHACALCRVRTDMPIFHCATSGPLG